MGGGSRLKVDVIVLDDGNRKEKMDLINNRKTKSIIELDGLIVHGR